MLLVKNVNLTTRGRNLTKTNKMKNTIKLKEVEFKDVPGLGGLQLWNPAYRHITLEQVEWKTREYSDFYNYGFFCRTTATIHLYQ